MHAGGRNHYTKCVQQNSGDDNIPIDGRWTLWLGRYDTAFLALERKLDDYGDWSYRWEFVVSYTRRCSGQLQAQLVAS
jgi:hypothetical protein